jgi:hypothetical protein
VSARVRALIAIVVGSGLHGFNWALSTGIVMGRAVYYPTTTIVGWVLIAIGVGGLVHGLSVTDQKPGRLVNAYALAGVVAAMVHLYLLGMFHDIAGLFQ